MTSLPRIFLLIPLYFQTATSVPTVAFPFNAQLPPVARIGSLYTYSFAEESFQSDSSISYSLGNHPAWLSLEGSERRLYGIPEDASVPSGEVVGQHVEIIATDDSGSATMDATLVVSRGQAPRVQIPISQQIREFGPFSPPASIIAYPATDFKYTFDQKTFSHDPGMINYYAVSGNSSPLPAWIHFDAPSLTFSGRTPPPEELSQPPHNFDIRLVASDIEGFSSISVDFSIVVGNHRLTTDHPIFELHVSRGDTVEYDHISDSIRLDNKVVKPGDLNVTTTDIPGWLDFDPDTWVLTGKPGKGDHSTNFTLQFSDAFADTLDLWGIVSVASDLFESTFHDIEATPGESFKLDLSKHFKDPDDIDLSFDVEPDQDWLELDGFTLKGKVPKKESGKLDLSIKAKSKSSGRTETENLGMIFLAADGSTTQTLTTTESRPSKTATSKHEHDSDSKSENAADKDQSKKDDEGGIGTSAILLATIIPVIAVALLIMLLACFIRRRRNRRSHNSNSTTVKKFRTKISNPVLNSIRSVNGRRHAGSAEDVERHMFGEKSAYAPPLSHRSSGSSDTLGSFSSQDTQVYMSTAAPGGPRTLGSAGTEEGRESWFTVDRAAQSPGTDITVPYSTHQLLPTPPFLAQTGDNAFRGGLDLTIPTLDELPSLHQTPDNSFHDSGRSPAIYSQMTTSSAALPYSRTGSPKSHPTPAVTARKMSSVYKIPEREESEKDWSTIREEPDDDVPRLPPPSLARLSSHNWLTRRMGEESRDSVVSDVSFSSTENWRVIATHTKPEKTEKIAPIFDNPLQTPTHLSFYKEVVATAPFHPSRPGTPPREEEEPESPVPQPKSQTAPDLLTTVSFTEASSKMIKMPQPTASRSKYSKLNESDESVTSIGGTSIGGSTRAGASTLAASTMGDLTNWRREDSSKTEKTVQTEGSYTVFL